MTKGLVASLGDYDFIGSGQEQGIHCFSSLPGDANVQVRHINNGSLGQ